MFEGLFGAACDFDIAVDTAAFEIAVEIGLIDEDFAVDAVMENLSLGDQFIHFARRDAELDRALLHTEHLAQSGHQRQANFRSTSNPEEKGITG